MPKVSVILPVYNVECYIQQTVQSVLEQTFPDFELLIIDDGSPDRSIELCRAMQDDRIHIITQANRGLAGARNTGIRHAAGEYLAFLDSDDLWVPTKLAVHVQHLDQSPTVGVSFCRSQFIDDQGNSLGIYQMPKLTGITADHLFCRNPIGNGSAAVIRKAVFDAIRFTDPNGTEDHYFDQTFRQSEDIECWLRIALQTQWQIEGIPEALTLYRVNTTGLSANVQKQLDSWEKLVTKTRTYAPEFVDRWVSLARAYQYRYLARRAIRSRDVGTAFDLMHRALASDWRILVREPRRTLISLAAAYLLRLLPKPCYRWLENAGMALTGLTQRWRIGGDRKQVRL